MKKISESLWVTPTFWTSLFVLGWWCGITPNLSTWGTLINEPPEMFWLITPTMLMLTYMSRCSWDKNPIWHHQS